MIYLSAGSMHSTMGVGTNGLRRVALMLIFDVSKKANDTSSWLLNQVKVGPGVLPQEKAES